MSYRHTSSAHARKHKAPPPPPSPAVDLESAVLSAPIQSANPGLRCPGPSPASHPTMPQAARPCSKRLLFDAPLTLGAAARCGAVDEVAILAGGVAACLLDWRAGQGWVWLLCTKDRSMGVSQAGLRASTRQRSIQGRRHHQLGEPARRGTHCHCHSRRRMCHPRSCRSMGWLTGSTGWSCRNAALQLQVRGGRARLVHRLQ